MKKLNGIIDSIDIQVDKRFGSFFKWTARHFTIFSSTIFVILLSIFIFKAVYHRSHYLASVIEQDITRIAHALADIDKNCNILSLNGERTAVNFLTVKSFVGTSVGGLNLAYPHKWQGPYLQVNPMCQQHFYELVQTKEGLFLVPGVGVKLPNGHIMGDDVKITAGISVKKLLEKNGVLNNDGNRLGLQLNFKVGDWNPHVKADRATLDTINFFVNEFNAAMPFTKNEAKIIETHHC